MSGPIIRKYGFPNFEKIFGERDLKHGAEAETPADRKAPVEPPKTTDKPEPAKPETGPAKP